MLEGIDRVNWSALTHAYGAAEDVPGLLRMLATGDESARGQALHAFYGNIFHQGTRYPATPATIPFLVEILRERPSPQLLDLITCCVAGAFGPAWGPFHTTGPVWGGGRGPMSDYGETEEIRTACEDAAAPAIPLAIELLHDKREAIRASAAWLLAACRKHGPKFEAVPRLADRLAAEPEPEVRAMRVFALGHLAPLGQNDALASALESDPDPLVRTMAAFLWVRRAKGEAPAHAIEVLLGALADPEPVDGGWTSLPFGSDGIASDLGSILPELGAANLERALPTLIAQLREVKDFGAVGLLAAALAATFPEGAPVPEDAASLTRPQRALLETLVANQRFWVIGNALNDLAERGLPSMREAMAEYLGVSMEVDPVDALKSEAQMYAGMDDQKVLVALAKAVKLAPDDVEVLSQLGSLLVATGDLTRGKTFLARAVELGDEDGIATFQLGYCFAQEKLYEEALECFEAASNLLADPEIARQNRIAMLQRLGRAEEAAALDAERGDPVDADGWFHRGLALVKAGKYDESIAAELEAIRLRPGDANQHYTIACAYCLRGDLDAALEQIATAIECDPDVAAQIADDSDFARLQSDPRFRKLVGRA